MYKLFLQNQIPKKVARNLLEKLYCCEIDYIEIAKTVLFAHHAKGGVIHK